MKLWDSDHPYIMTLGNYFSNDCHTDWDSLDAFLAEFGDMDIDYNLVIRWDWCEGPDWDLSSYSGFDTERFARLRIQILHQRKAILCSHEIAVCRADEPAARAYLESSAKRIAQNWAPILVA